MKRLITLIIVLICLLQHSLQAISYFEKDKLSLDSGKTGFVPSTPNLTNSATKIVGGLALKNGLVIAGSLQTILDQVTPFIGAIMPVAVTKNANIPAGWLPCDGRVVSINAYPLLYSKIKDQWGSTTKAESFKLPNLARVFLRGQDTRGTSAGRDSSRAVGSFQSDAISEHTHTVQGSTPTGSIYSLPAWSITGGAHTHTLAGYYTLSASGTESPDGEEARAESHNLENYQTSTPLNGGVAASLSHTHSYITPTGSLTGGGATEMLPKRIYLIYCIKATPF